MSGERVTRRGSWEPFDDDDGGGWEGSFGPYRAHVSLEGGWSVHWIDGCAGGPCDSFEDGAESVRAFFRKHLNDAGIA